MDTTLEHWWNVLTGETTFWEENRSKCHFVHHKSDISGGGRPGRVTVGRLTVVPLLFVGADLTQNIFKFTS
jgi:hypothetical protein